MTCKSRPLYSAHLCHSFLSEYMFSVDSNPLLFFYPLFHSLPLLLQPFHSLSLLCITSSIPPLFCAYLSTPPLFLYLSNISLPFSITSSILPPFPYSFAILNLHSLLFFYHLSFNLSCFPSPTSFTSFF